MTLKRSVFGTYVKDGLDASREDTEKKRKGFRNHRKRKVKLKNPFHIFNHIFNFNKDFTKVPTIVKINQNRKNKFFNGPIANKSKIKKG